jgi:catechol 2,3-dioxygenase
MNKLKPTHKNPNPIDPGVDIGHVHLKSANLDPIYDFYVGVLGFDVVTRLPTALFLSAGGYHHHLAFNTWESEGGGPAPKHTTGLYHVAIRYPSRAALGDALRRLEKAGWPFEGVNDHGTHEALYLRDPDDNGLELYWDRPESEWPLDKDGHLALAGRQLDLAGLMKEGT